MGWHLVQKYLEQVGEHSTLVGKFWVTFFLVLRYLMLVSIADTVFKDEQGSFVCNTITPGCNNICFNDFSPISLLRYWALQVLATSIPSVLFIIYTAHKLLKIDQAKKIRKTEKEKKKKKAEAKRLKAIEEKKRRGDLPPEYTEKDEKSKKKEAKKDSDEKVVATQLDSDTPPRLLLAYVGQAILRLLVEIGFTIYQFKIYVFQFWVPELFKCARYPCPNVVDCFVSRPKEKTIMMWVMFATSLIMIVLGVLELYHLGFRKIAKAWSKRGHDITKEYRLKDNVPSFGTGYRGAAKYARGYPQAVGMRVAYATSNFSGDEAVFEEETFM